MGRATASTLVGLWLTMGFLGSAALGGGAGTKKVPREEPPPAYWQPFGRAELEPFRAEAIKKGSVVLPCETMREQLAAAVYDREADRWQAYVLDDAQALLADHPHAWLVRKSGDCLHYDTAAGSQKELKALFPPSRSHQALMGGMFGDIRVPPHIFARNGKLWKWERKTRALSSLDPADGKWGEPVVTPDLKGAYLWDVAESPGHLWASLAPPSGMRGEYGVMAFDKAAKAWSRISERFGRLAPQGSGVWLCGEKTQFWDPKEGRLTRELPQASQLCVAGAKLWGASYGWLVADDGKGGWQRFPPGSPVRYVHADQLAYDGRHVWSWWDRPLGPVTRTDPATLKHASYPVVQGLTSDAKEMVFGPADIWVKDAEGQLVRHDRRTGAWRILSRRDGSPSNRFGTLAFGSDAIYAREDALGIARYDFAKEALTHFPPEECCKPSWPYAQVPEAIEQALGKREMACVWIMLVMAQRLRTASSPWVAFDGDDAWFAYGQSLYCWNARSGDVRELRTNEGLAGPIALGKDAVWCLTFRDGSLAVIVDKKTGQTERFRWPMPPNARLISTLQAGEELWVCVERAIVRANLNTRQTRTFTAADCPAIANCLMPVASDDGWLWGRLRDHGYILGYHRKLDRWVELTYLKGGLWFDGPWVYSNLHARPREGLHRAEKAEFLADALRQAQAAR